MPRKNKDQRGEGIRLAGVLIPSLLPLVFKLGKTYLRFKKVGQKAGKIFEKELRTNGPLATSEKPNPRAVSFQSSNSLG